MTQTASATQSGTSNENVMSLVAYILTWVTGLIVLLTSPKTAKTQRWHAIQAIGVGIAWTVVSLLGNIWGGSMMAFGASPVSAGPIALVFLVLNLGFLVLWIVLMITAYQGKKIRLPIIADIADKNA